jgi:hypothetical protein
MQRTVTHRSPETNADMVMMKVVVANAAVLELGENSTDQQCLP